MNAETVLFFEPWEITVNVFLGKQGRKHIHGLKPYSRHESSDLNALADVSDAGSYCKKTSEAIVG